jgi:hypothetical protein
MIHKKTYAGAPILKSRAVISNEPSPLLSILAVVVVAVHSPAVVVVGHSDLHASCSSAAGNNAGVSRSNGRR